MMHNFLETCVVWLIIGMMLIGAASCSTTNGSCPGDSNKTFRYCSPTNMHMSFHEAYAFCSARGWRLGATDKSQADLLMNSLNWVSTWSVYGNLWTSEVISTDDGARLPRYEARAENFNKGWCITYRRNSSPISERCWVQLPFACRNSWDMEIKETPFQVSVYSTWPLEYLSGDVSTGRALFDKDPLTSFNVSLEMEDKYPVIVLDFEETALAWMKLHSQISQFLVIEACFTVQSSSLKQDQGHCYYSDNGWNNGLKKESRLVTDRHKLFVDPDVAVVIKNTENIVYFPKVVVNQIRIYAMSPAESYDFEDSYKIPAINITRTDAIQLDNISLSEIKIGHFPPPMVSAVLSVDPLTRQILYKNYSDAVAYCRRHRMQLDLTTPYQAFQAAETFYNNQLSFNVETVWSSIKYTPQGWRTDRCCVEYSLSSDSLYWMHEKTTDENYRNFCAVFSKVEKNEGAEAGFRYKLHKVGCDEKHPFACKLEQEVVHSWSPRTGTFYEAVDDCAEQGLALSTCIEGLSTSVLESEPPYIRAIRNTEIWGCLGEFLQDDVMSSAVDTVLFTSKTIETKGEAVCRTHDLLTNPDAAYTFDSCMSQKWYSCAPFDHGVESYFKPTPMYADFNPIITNANPYSNRELLTDGDIYTCYSTIVFPYDETDSLFVTLLSEFQAQNKELDDIQMVKIYTKEGHIRLGARSCDHKNYCKNIKFPETTVENDWTIFYFGGVSASKVEIFTMDKSYLPAICEVEVIAFNNLELPYEYIGPRPMNYDDATNFCTQRGLHLGGTTVEKYSVMKVFKTAGKNWDTLWSSFNRIGSAMNRTDAAGLELKSWESWPWKSWLSDYIGGDIQYKYSGFIWDDGDFSISRLCAAYLREGKNRAPFVLSDRPCEEKHNFVCGKLN
jgi:hypothetical protein